MPDTPGERAFLTKRPVHVRDLAVALRHKFKTLKGARRTKGIRTVLVMPMLVGNTAVGVIIIRRTKVRPFTPKQIALLNRDMLSRRLERRGFEVVTAVDGEQGLAIAESAAPALILMDMSLPGIDGWEVPERLKASPATKTIPIIALTAHAMAGDREKALATSCDDFDTKPIELPRLVAKIDALLGTKG